MKCLVSSIPKADRSKKFDDDESVFVQKFRNWIKMC